MNKPLISFLLLSYNQEEYINDAVDGAFSQTYSTLEIIISDDCSNDNTYICSVK
jgi:glycosyltransferase involved in cell wall biosynthesis